VDPQHDVAEMPTERMGPPSGALPPMRMTASWSGPEVDLPNTSLWREKMRPMASSLGSLRRKLPLARMVVEYFKRGPSSSEHERYGGLPQGRCRLKPVAFGDPCPSPPYRSVLITGRDEATASFGRTKQLELRSRAAGQQRISS